VSANADGVLSLCDDPEAMIEVKAASDAPHEPLDVTEVTGQRRGAANAWAQAPAPAAAAPPPAVAPPQAAAPPPAASAPPRPQVYATQQQAPAPQPVPMPAPAAVAPNNAGHPYAGGQQGAIGGGDVEQLMGELMQMTDEALGNRARKVKDVLAAAERSRPGLESAIDQIPGISILFVDASRLEALANDLRARLQTHLR
jgi:hypothetical protein